MNIDIKQIDFKKYKRFFAFGCSFTSYIWPTWADVLSKEMPNAEYYNGGHCGAGNLMITARMTEADARFKFCETDLVVILWSTFCREDRYFDNSWQCPGNIFSQGLYDAKFVKKFADTRGYLIRDLVLISNATSYLKNLPCDAVTLSSVPFDYQNEDRDVSDVLTLYKGTTQQIPESLFTLEMNREWTCGHHYKHSQMGDFGDYHPDTLRYMEYLRKVGFNLTANSINYAKDSFFKLKKTKTDKEMLKYFSDNSQGNVKGWL
jgi:hypothetical protein